MKPLRLALYTPESTEAEHSEVTAALSIALHCLGEPWLFVDFRSYYSLLCIWIETEDDLAALRSAEKRCPLERLIVLSTIEVKTQAKWQWQINNNKKYPDVLNLINLFSRVQAYLLSSHTSMMQMFEPSLYFTGVLQTALADGIARVCSIPDYPKVYLLPKEDKVYINGDLDLLAPLAITFKDEINVEKITDNLLLEKVDYVRFSSRIADYAELLEKNLTKANMASYQNFSFAEAIWFSIFIAARGRLMVNINLEQPLSFEQIPEFFNKKYSNLTPVVEEFMTMPLQQILSKNKTHANYALINLYNACTDWLKKDLVSAKASTELSFQDLTQFINSKTNLKGKKVIIVASESGEERADVIESLKHLHEMGAIIDHQANEIVLSPETSLFIHSIPELAKFDFTSEMICENAWGLIILINHTHKNALNELEGYLKLCRAYFKNEVHVVIGLCQYRENSELSLADYESHLQNKQVNYPIIIIDNKRLAGSLSLLMSLISQ